MSKTTETHQALDARLRKEGVQMQNWVDAMRWFGNGGRLFAFHEMDEDFVEVTSMDHLNNCAPDQLMGLPADPMQADAAASAPQKCVR